MEKADKSEIESPSDSTPDATRELLKKVLEGENSTLDPEQVTALASALDQAQDVVKGHIDQVKNVQEMLARHSQGLSASNLVRVMNRVNQVITRMPRKTRYKRSGGKQIFIRKLATSMHKALRDYDQVPDVGLAMGFMTNLIAINQPSSQTNKLFATLERLSTQSDEPWDRTVSNSAKRYISARPTGMCKQPFMSRYFNEALEDDDNTLEDRLDIIKIMLHHGRNEGNMAEHLERFDDLLDSRQAANDTNFLKAAHTEVARRRKNKEVEYMLARLNGAERDPSIYKPASTFPKKKTAQPQYILASRLEAAAEKIRTGEGELTGKEMASLTQDAKRFRDKAAKSNIDKDRAKEVHECIDLIIPHIANQLEQHTNELDLKDLTTLAKNGNSFGNTILANTISTTLSTKILTIEEIMTPETAIEFLKFYVSSGVVIEDGQVPSKIAEAFEGFLDAPTDLQVIDLIDLIDCLRKRWSTTELDTAVRDYFERTLPLQSLNNQEKTIGRIGLYDEGPLKNHVQKILDDLRDEVVDPLRNKIGGQINEIATSEVALSEKLDQIAQCAEENASELGPVAVAASMKPLRQLAFNAKEHRGDNAEHYATFLDKMERILKFTQVGIKDRDAIDILRGFSHLSPRVVKKSFLELIAFNLSRDVPSEEKSEISKALYGLQCLDSETVPRKLMVELAGRIQQAKGTISVKTAVEAIKGLQGLDSEVVPRSLLEALIPRVSATEEPFTADYAGRALFGLQGLDDTVVPEAFLEAIYNNIDPSSQFTRETENALRGLYGVRDLPHARKIRWMALRSIAQRKKRNISDEQIRSIAAVMDLYDYKRRSWIRARYQRLLATPRPYASSWEQKAHEALMSANPDDEIHSNYLYEGSEMDIYAPDFNLNIEIDGPQHFAKRSRDKRRDEHLSNKHAILVWRINITNMTRESLEETLRGVKLGNAVEQLRSRKTDEV